ncbi:MAG: hypothetical protein KGO96_13060 [Elusimicrobia bacterium]|nr:hypothetical protein [Elusimicrobiota bacterium]MDE2426823.1 hypothetical protein [Elusimicrobiota bacterium]
MKASTKDVILARFDPVEIITVHKYTKYIKASKKLKEELAEKDGRGVAGTVTLRVLMDLAADRALDLDEPFHVYIFRSPLIRQVVYDATDEAKLPRAELYSRPKTAAEMRQR